MLKRLVDVVLGSILAILALPIMVLLALCLAVALRTSPFFVQERVGYRGRRFKVLKLRTLPRRTSPTANKYEIAGLELGWLPRMLRAAHLDELPQLILVPLGYMSLVGPRPEMPRLHFNGDADFAEARVAQRPGCTGLWQISVDAHRLIWEAPTYDLYYVRNASLRLDLWIMWRTALLLSGIKPAATLDEVPAWAAPARPMADAELALDSELGLEAAGGRMASFSSSNL